jgi:multiple sugar transport system ATP-binding protein
VFVAGFIGSPAMNLFPAEIVSGGVKFGTDTAKIPDDVTKATKDKHVTVGIRPEDLDWSKSGKGIEMKVVVVEELGADGYLYGEAESGGQKIDVVVRVDGRDHPMAGDTIVITPKPAHIHVFDVQSGLRLGSSRVKH